MKKFDTVVIGCDMAFGMVESALMLRTMLESRNIRVYLHKLIHKQHVLDFLARNHPETEYVIIMCHGDGTNEEPSLRFDVIDRIEGQLDHYGREMWQGIKFYLTPQNIPELVTKAQGTLISVACASGRKPLADAFLKAGYKGYIAPTDWNDAGTLFLTGFFHHLLAEDSDDPVFTAVKYSDKEAAALAALHDLKIKDSVQTFQHFE